MLSFNIGAYAASLMKPYQILRWTQVYDRGVKVATVLPPESVLAHIQPRKNSTAQLMQINSDRVYGKITIFTLIDLDLTRQNVQATEITFMNNQYFVTANRDWNEFGYFQYFGELIIPQATG